MAIRGTDHRDAPECFGRAECYGCLWREECVRATLSRPPDRRYGPRRRNASVRSQSDREGSITNDMDQVPTNDANGPQRRT